MANEGKKLSLSAKLSCNIDDDNSNNSRKRYHKILERRWDYIVISHVYLTDFFLSKGNCAEHFISSLKDFDKRKKGNCNFCHKKTGGVSMQLFFFFFFKYKVIIFSGVLWKSSPVLRFVAEPGDVSVAVRSQARRLPISRGAVRVLKRSEQLTPRTEGNMLWTFSAI